MCLSRDYKRGQVTHSQLRMSKTMRRLEYKYWNEWLMARDSRYIWKSTGPSTYCLLQSKPTHADPTWPYVAYPVVSRIIGTLCKPMITPYVLYMITRLILGHLSFKSHSGGRDAAIWVWTPCILYEWSPAGDSGSRNPAPRP